MSIEINKILEERDFSLVIEYPNNTGNRLSRAELEDICQLVIGQPTPNNNVRFIVKSLDDKYFNVMYIKSWDKFLYDKVVAR